MGATIIRFASTKAAANARDVSTLISLRQPIYHIMSADKTKFVSSF